MANLRRHFNFSTKSSVNQDREIGFTLPSGKSTYRQFDKTSFMSDICNCLDLCSSYIQALNELCNAGSSLAKHISHTVREIPAFHQVSLQFSYIWEEASKATAGASAAVKTETLMMLQEILNSLEIGKGDDVIETTIAESFQVIGTCMCSFIELQAQFSLSTWKSLSKLSKHFTGDSMRHSLQWKSLDRATSKILINTDLNATIKKHFSQFSKVRTSKSHDVGNTQTQAFLPNNQDSANMPMYSPFSAPPSSLESSENNLLWSPSPCLWDSFTASNIRLPQNTLQSEQEFQASPKSGLDEVINLLSCVPVEQTPTNMNNKNYFQCQSNTEQVYHILPKVAHVSRQLGIHRALPKDMSIGYDSWLWKPDNINCLGLPASQDAILPLQTQSRGEYLSYWQNKELQKWNMGMFEAGSSSDDGSSSHDLDSEHFPNCINGSFGKHILNSFANRKHSSGESMPGGLENISESKEEYSWGHSKISTWPFKQSTFRTSDGPKK